MDLKDVYALMERFEKSGLSEISVKKDGEEICLKKAPPMQIVATPAPLPHAVHESRAA